MRDWLAFSGLMKKVVDVKMVEEVGKLNFTHG